MCPQLRAQDIMFCDKLELESESACMHARIVSLAVISYRAATSAYRAAIGSEVV